jgi:hypothetical protein
VGPSGGCGVAAGDAVSAGSGVGVAVGVAEDDTMGVTEGDGSAGESWPMSGVAVNISIATTATGLAARWVSTDTVTVDPFLVLVLAHSSIPSRPSGVGLKLVVQTHAGATTNDA